MSSSKFVLSYQMLNFGGLAVAALLLLTSPHLLILLIGGLVSAGVFLDSDVSMKLMERFGRKPGKITPLMNSELLIYYGIKIYVCLN